MTVSMDSRRRRAVWRAWHRGTREMDLILGPFADRRVGEMSEAELALFEEILQEPDPSLHDWITGREVIPTVWSVMLKEIAER